MPGRRLRLAAACCAALTLAALTASGAGGAGAVVEYEGLVLRADGGFAPRTLPRQRYAPIEFRGHFDIAERDGSQPPALQRAVILFDHDGRLGAAGLPTCPLARIAAADTAEARARCRGAIVGSGHLGALVRLSSSLVPARAALTIFNAPRVDGHPAVILHARTTTPNLQTYAILAPIERIPGEFGYRVTIDIPPIAGGLGSLTHLDATLGRRYRAGGKRRSYLAARCSDNVLRTRGTFLFGNGLVVEGGVEKFCRQT
ncbi:MAG: hypothetical protein U0R71_08605 [Solirubrobacterales bacterium]